MANNDLHTCNAPLLMHHWSLLYVSLAMAGSKARTAYSASWCASIFPHALYVSYPSGTDVGKSNNTMLNLKLEL